MGSIPKYPNFGFKKITSGYEMSLKRLARFRLLQNFEASLARRVSSLSHNWNAAEFAENIWWPALAREIRRVKGLPQWDGDESPDFPYFERIRELWAEIQPADVMMQAFHSARPCLFSYMPRRLNVGEPDAPTLRFLSYNMIDYARDGNT